MIQRLEHNIRGKRKQSRSQSPRFFWCLGADQKKRGHEKRGNEIEEEENFHKRGKLRMLEPLW